MNNRGRLSLIVIVMLALLVSSCVREKKQTVKGEEAPDFTLSELRGAEFRLSGLKGKVVLLEFWATWCPPCRESIPAMNELYRRYNDRGLVILGISVDKGKNVVEDLQVFIKEHPILYPVLIDNKNINNLYGVYSIPTTILIDKEGKIVSKNIGFSPEIEESLSKEIERLL